MTAEELRTAQAALEASSARYENDRQYRDSKVCSAIEAGWTHTQVAEATGLTRGRVGQIAQRYGVRAVDRQARPQRNHTAVRVPPASVVPRTTRGA